MIQSNPINRKNRKKLLEIFLLVLSLGIIIFLLGAKGFDLNFQVKAQSEEISDSIDLSNLVADVDLEARKSILYMPQWPDVIEQEKVLFIPSTGIGTIYLCPQATSLSEVTPQCKDIEILNTGQSKDNLFVDSTTYNNQEYYLVYGVKGTGGGEALKTQLTYEGDLSGQYSDEINLKATLTTQNGESLIGKTIDFILGNQTDTATTDENGIATTTMALLQTSGNYNLEVKFTGEGDYLPSSDSESFEIQKEKTIITISDKEGFTFDDITLEVKVLDEDGRILIGGPYEVDFKINNKVIGKAQIDGNGFAKINWNINLISKELAEIYPIVVSFTENDYYLPAEGQANFTLKSAKWLKQDTISELQKLKTNDQKLNKKIDTAIGFINQSLNECLWQDASHLIFFEKGKCTNFEKFLIPEDLDFNKLGQQCPKLGIMVFYYEKAATELMMPNSQFKEIIGKLVKADFLLAKVSLFDVKNMPIKNPKIKKIIEIQITLAEKELQKANSELQKGKPDKAILRLAKSWLYSQMAMKFANF